MSIHEFRLPDVGEGLTDADIVTWYVAVGDEVTIDQNLCEIETAKSAVDLPSPVAGTIAEILVTSGNVPVGTPLVRIQTAAGPEEEQQQPQAETDRRQAQAGAAAEEDKAPAMLVGYGARQAPQRRERRAATTPATPAEPAHEGAPQSRPASSATGTPTAPGTQSDAAQGTQSDAAPGTQSDAAQATQSDAAGAHQGSAAMPVYPAAPRVMAKPPVRSLAKDLGIDLTAIGGSGPGGIITREDVLAYHEAGTARSLATYEGDEPWLEGGIVSADGRRTRVPARAVRKRTAEAVVHSAFTAPHVTEFHSVDITRTMDLLAELKQDREFRDLRLTPLLLVMKALLIAVKRHPEINASWDDDSQEIIYKHYVNLGIAAATPRGLVVPNIKDAHRKSLPELAHDLGELTRNARAGKTSPSAMKDGTITITNVGAFGIDTGTPILNPGESAILALGGINQRPWVHDGELAVRWVTQLALSFDHRLVDGALGSMVLADVARLLHDPGQALVWG